MERFVCKSCGATLLWARTGKGAIPLDAQPVQDGNIQLEHPSDPREAPVAVFITTKRPPAPGERYISHFVTCPRAADWRRSP